jgi:hypothetical protein
MDARRSQDGRRAVAQLIFAALCAHYPDRQIALFEHPQAAVVSPEWVLITFAAAPAVQSTRGGTERKPR